MSHTSAPTARRGRHQRVTIAPGVPAAAGAVAAGAHAPAEAYSHHLQLLESLGAAGKTTFPRMLPASLQMRCDVVLRLGKCIVFVCALDGEYAHLKPQVRLCLSEAPDE